MTRKLYLHVGPTKTATTVIQSVLAGHDNSVVVYPKVGLAGSGGHHNLLWNFQGIRSRQQFIEADIGGLFEEIGRVARDTRLDIVISSESMTHGEMPDEIAAGLNAFVGSLLPYLGPDPPEAEIVFGAREHFERAASLYNNRLLRRPRRGFLMTPDEFLLGCIRELCYAETLGPLANLDLKLAVLNYHPREDWVRRFLKHVGFEESACPEIPSRNISFGPAHLIARLAANRALSNDEEIRAFLAGLTDSRKLRYPSQFIFGRTAAAAAEQIFQADRDFLRTNHGIVFAPPDIETEENMFFIDGAAFAEIEAAATPFGPRGTEIARFAATYLR